MLNTSFLIPPVVTLGVGKSATAKLIQSLSSAYKDQGIKYAYLLFPVQLASYLGARAAFAVPLDVNVRMM